MARRSRIWPGLPTITQVYLNDLADMVEQIAAQSPTSFYQESPLRDLDDGTVYLVEITSGSNPYSGRRLDRGEDGSTQYTITGLGDFEFDTDFNPLYEKSGRMDVPIGAIVEVRLRGVVRQASLLDNVVTEWEFDYDSYEGGDTPPTNPPTFKAPVTIQNTSDGPHILLQNYGSNTVISTPPAGYVAIVSQNQTLKVLTATGLVCILCGKGSCNCGCEAPCDLNVSALEWVNQDDAIFTIHNSGEAATLYDPSGSVTYDMAILKQAAPETPYTVTAKLVLTHTIGSGRPIFGLLFRESSGGTFHAFGLRLNNSGHVDLNNPAAFSDLVMFSQKWGAPDTEDTYYVEDTPAHLAQMQEFYLRLRDDGTNRILEFSGDAIQNKDVDNLNFLPFDTQGRTDYLTADEVGLFIDAEDSDGLLLTLCCWSVSHYVDTKIELELEWSSTSIVGPYTKGPIEIELEWTSYSSVGHLPIEVELEWISYSAEWHSLRAPIELEVEWASVSYYGDPDLQQHYKTETSPPYEDLGEKTLESSNPPVEEWETTNFSYDGTTSKLVLYKQGNNLYLELRRVSDGFVRARWLIATLNYDPTGSNDLSLIYVGDGSGYPNPITVGAFTPPTDYTFKIKCEETGGEPYVDESVNGHNFEDRLMGLGPISITGKVGNGLRFNAASADGIISEDAFARSTSQSWSMKVWFRIDTTGTSSQSLLSFTDLRVITSGNVLQVWNLTDTWVEDEWFLVVVGYDNDTGERFFSKNGGAKQSEVATASFGPAAVAVPGSINFTDWILSFDEIEYYERALSEAEITAIYLAEN